MSAGPHHAVIKRRPRPEWTKIIRWFRVQPTESFPRISEYQSCAPAGMGCSAHRQFRMSWLLQWGPASLKQTAWFISLCWSATRPMSCHLRVYCAVWLSIVNTLRPFIVLSWTPGRPRLTVIHPASTVIRRGRFWLCVETVRRCIRPEWSIHYNKQEAELPQRDRATLWVSCNLVNCCTTARKWHFKMPTIGAWSWRSPKVSGIAAIRLVTFY